MEFKKINTALISVYHKEGLSTIIKNLDDLGVTIYSTGGTQKYIEEQGVQVRTVEGLTSYPSILDGRVKTLHPKVFGGILAKREDSHLTQLDEYDIPEIDLIIVDLYPFEDTVRNTSSEEEIIEKIDIGGISLIRAAAKNYRDVLVVASKDEYALLHKLLQEKNGASDVQDRQEFARRAFKVSSHYDTAIFDYFNQHSDDLVYKKSIHQHKVLRYGENPHQRGVFFGDLEEIFELISGKELSYNNLVDVDAAVSLMTEFKQAEPTFAILKHTNSCGVAIRPTLYEAWQAALACDNISAFGGILIANRSVDLKTAQAIDQIFYEVLIAPDFQPDALEILTKKKKRIILRLKKYPEPGPITKTLLNGVIMQDPDTQVQAAAMLKTVTKNEPESTQVDDLLFAATCAKHLKSNTIVLSKNRQMIGMGCGQTSRVDALKQAVAKARQFGFDVQGAVMASDAFFPFPDCVEIADQAGVTAVIQPGGSIKDQESIDYCDKHGLVMVTTGVRHFKH
ncbi:MAG: bifunctional phosphoribosylaminoimidazolecarboxamide formyltransferase/IMP cyclohydrolase [Saprospiraceae bacterium]|nr:bifunctional phosphoribosylaminoimidazolecarboxamide formyltransferase/IMP cyclohydrolase [Saprospiraceae bacterium]